MQANKPYYLKNFWKSLPTKSFVKLSIAVFFTFSSIGFVSDIFSFSNYSYWVVLKNVFLSGMIPVFGLLAFMRHIKYVLFVVLCFILLVINPETQIITNVGILKNRFLVDGFSIILVVMMGYFFFITFISTEGIKHSELQTEVALAQDIHKVLVPPISMETERFEIYGKSVPASEVGGDLLDTYSRDGKLTCYIADVSGHGVSAGLLMGMFKSAARTQLMTNNSLTDFLNVTNNVIFQVKKKNMFITCACIKFNGANEAEFSLAGHLPILHYLSQTKIIEQHSVKQIGLGLKEKYNFKTRRIVFSPGDIIVLLTDGLTEVFDIHDNEFGISRIEQFIIENYMKSLAEIYEGVLLEIKQYGEQRDDQTMLLIRCL